MVMWWINFIVIRLNKARKYLSNYLVKIRDYLNSIPSLLSHFPQFLSKQKRTRSSLSLMSNCNRPIKIAITIYFWLYVIISTGHDIMDPSQVRKNFMWMQFFFPNASEDFLRSRPSLEEWEIKYKSPLPNF